MPPFSKQCLLEVVTATSLFIKLGSWLPGYKSPRSARSRLGFRPAAAAKSLQSCPTLCDPIDSRLPCPRDSPGKNTGVGCHFLLQCMKVKSRSEVAQLCLTLSDPMDCSLPGSSIHGIFQARVLEWGAIAFSGFQAYSSQKNEIYFVY